MESKIRLLAPSIAERIAAGEVVERPSSVVKELIENSLDAGSTEISVALEDGGKALIEVLDNGHGMSSKDLELCIERHATSKLNSLEDLECITTLGFRGEALPSIAAVSDLSIISRTASSSAAYQLSAGEITARFEHRPQAQKITYGQFIDTSHGTQIRAQGLFAQVPARLKFLKSQAAEVSQVREWMERLAIAHPQVGFQLKSDDRMILNLRPETETSRIQSVLSDGDDYPIITVENEQDGFRDLGLQVRIHWLQGLSSPNSRRLVQVVNRRPLRDRLIQQAVLNPFRQALLPGQFPAIAIFVDINPAAIDVNVHPTKTEIRFLDTRKIFSTVETLVKSMIARAGAPAIVPVGLTQKPLGARETSVPLAKTSFPPVEMPAPSPGFWEASEKTSSPAPLSPRKEFQSFSSSPTPPPSSSGPAQNKGGSSFSRLYPPPPPLPLTAENPFQHARQVGAIFNTYLLYEKDSTLILLDQHAAHERIRYEKLRRRILGSDDQPVALSSQALLLPEVVRFSSDDFSILEERLKWIAPLGFETEFFGGDTLLFRGVPAEWGTRQLKVRLKNLVDRLLSLELKQDAMIFDEVLFEALASEACHSAIRAGDRLEPEEMVHLVQQLFECEHPWNCPHGRPTVVKVPQGKLEEWFQRKL